MGSLSKEHEALQSETLDSKKQSGLVLSRILLVLPQLDVPSQEQSENVFWGYQVQIDVQGFDVCVGPIWTHFTHNKAKVET